MEAFLISLSTIAIAEMGDRTQFLALILAARFRKPWAIMAAILLATLADHLAAGAIGIWFGHKIVPSLLDGLVGCSMVVMALWTILVPDKAGENEETGARGAFATTLIAFSIAELGDKTQIATLGLAAAYNDLVPVVAGSTLGMLLANAPGVFLGNTFANHLPIAVLRYLAATLFLGLGVYFITRALWS